MSMHDERDDLSLSESICAALMAVALFAAVFFLLGCGGPVHPLRADTLCPAGGNCSDCSATCESCKGACRAKPVSQAKAGPLSIDAPATIEAGNLVKLTAKGDYSQLKWKWKCVPESNNFDSDGGKAWFCSPAAGTFHFILAGGDGTNTELAVHVLTVVGGPAPPPGPGPGPQPPPVTPLKSLATQWLTKVSSPKKYDEAQALASAYEGVASAIASGALKTPEEIVSACKTQTRETLGLLGIPAWLPLLEPLAAELQARQKNGTLDAAQCLRDLAAALREVKPPAVVVPPAPQPAAKAYPTTPSSRTQAQRRAA